jgi:hypothetical protein
MYCTDQRCFFDPPLGQEQDSSKPSPDAETDGTGIMCDLAQTLAGFVPGWFGEAASGISFYKDMFEKKSADAVLDLIEAAIGPWDVIVAPLHFIADHPDAGYDPTARAVGVHACNGTFDYATGRPCTVYINGAPYHPPAQ